MLTSLTVRNWPPLSGLHLEPLSRINVVVGANGIGKSRLLAYINRVFPHVVLRPEAGAHLHPNGLQASVGSVLTRPGQAFHETHNIEWIEALVAMAKERDCVDDLGLIRLEWEAGRVIARCFTGRALLAAIETGGEIR